MGCVLSIILEMAFPTSWQASSQQNPCNVSSEQPNHCVCGRTFFIYFCSDLTSLFDVYNDILWNLVNYIIFFKLRTCLHATCVAGNSSLSLKDGVVWCGFVGPNVYNK